MNCTECDKKIDDYRYHLGYKVCVKCSDTEKYAAHVVYPHKTGAFVQPVSKTASKNLKKIERRSTGTARVAKGIYADNSWDRWLKDYEAGKFKPKKPIGPKGKPLKNTHTSYDMALELCYDYYIKWGYEPSLDFVKDLYKQDKISMMTKTRIVNQITNLQVLPKKTRKWVIKNQLI